MDYWAPLAPPPATAYTPPPGAVHAVCPYRLLLSLFSWLESLLSLFVGASFERFSSFLGVYGNYSS